jgi:putative aldouronate transport system permease protein
MSSSYDKPRSLFQISLWIFFGMVIFLTLLPILNIVAVSLSGKDAILRGEVGLYPKNISFEAYEMVLRNGPMVKSVFYSLALTAGTSALSICMTILAAYPLSKPYLKGRSIFMLLITVTMYVHAGIIPDYLLMKELHLINNVMVLVLPGVISAFNLIILRSFFASINASLFEAARMDGCGEWRALIKIAIPMALPSIFTIILFSAVARWNGLSDVLYYINKPDLYTMQFRLKLMLDTINLPIEAGEVNRQVTPENVKAATVLFSMLPMLVIYPFVQKFFTKGVMIGGVKE